MKKIVISTVLSALLITSFAYAEEIPVTQESEANAVVESQDKVVITQNEVKEQNELIEDYDEAGDILDDLFNDFEEQKGISYGKVEGQQKYFITGKSSVTAKITDKDFPKTVTIAYERAMTDIQVQFVTDIYGTLATEKIQELFQNNSQNAKSFTDKEIKDATTSSSKFGNLLDKVVELGEKKLDAALIELGVDAESLIKKPIKLKKDIFKSTFKKNILTKAAGSVAGLFPVQTFIVGDEGNGYAVGVIAMYSDKSKQVAKDIASGSKSIIKGKGRDIKEVIERDTSKYPSQFGIRLAYDKHGQPAIISYGQWSYVKNKSNSFINETLKKTAYETAGKLADAQIVEFIKGKLSATDERTIGDEVSVTAEQEATTDSMVEVNEASDIIETINKKSKLKAKGSISGVSTFKRWRHKEKGHNYVGVVRVWTYGAKTFAKNVHSGKGIKEAKKIEKESMVVKAKQVVKAGANYNVDDF